MKKNINIRLAGKAEAYYQICAAIASLEKRKVELTKDIKAIARVTPGSKQRELLTPKYRLLVSWIKKCKVPAHWRAGHSKITRCDIRPEWIVSKRMLMNIPLGLDQVTEKARRANLKEA